MCAATTWSTSRFHLLSGLLVFGIVRRTLELPSLKDRLIFRLKPEATRAATRSISG